MNERLSQLLTATGLEQETFMSADNEENVFNGILPAGAAVSTWGGLAKGYVETGYWPVLRGDTNDLQERPEHNARECLANAPRGDIRELLMLRLNERIESLRAIEGELPSTSPFPANPCDVETLAKWADSSGVYSFGGNAGSVNDWPAPPEPQKRVTFETVRSHKGKPMAVSLVRCQKPYECPAYLGFGGWNDCPSPELQVAVLREWRNTYRVAPVCITGDVVECMVLNPPQTEAEAMLLAAEQWLFCEDIVAQGTQSIRKLAMEIWQSRRWFFWWD